MTDLAMRRKLAQDLRQLAAGSITNWEFDDSYCDRYADSDDSTVRTLGEQGYSLYSDTPKYRLRGRHAVDEGTRAAVARCVLMLRAGVDYSWPHPPRSFLRKLADTFALPGVAVGAAISIVWSMLVLTETKDVEFMTPFGVAGIALLACSVWYLLVGVRSSQETPAWKEWMASGDYDVWPFLRRADFDAARQNPSARLLAKLGSDGET
jgi:hypothetical protein